MKLHPALDCITRSVCHSGESNWKNYTLIHSCPESFPLSLGKSDSVEKIPVLCFLQIENYSTGRAA